MRDRFPKWCFSAYRLGDWQSVAKMLVMLELMLRGVVLHLDILVRPGSPPWNSNVSSRPLCFIES